MCLGSILTLLESSCSPAGHYHRAIYNFRPYFITFCCLSSTCSEDVICNRNRFGLLGDMIRLYLRNRLSRRVKDKMIYFFIFYFYFAGAASSVRIGWYIPVCASFCPILSPFPSSPLISFSPPLHVRVYIHAPRPHGIRCVIIPTLLPLCKPPICPVAADGSSGAWST